MPLSTLLDPLDDVLVTALPQQHRWSCHLIRDARGNSKGYAQVLFDTVE